MFPSQPGTPLRSVVAPWASTAVEPCDASDRSADAEPDGGGPEELEEAYRRALEAADVAEAWMHDADVPAPDPSAEAFAAAPSGSDPEAPASALPAESPADAAPATHRAEQILEALLFVGGEPLTSRRLAELLGGGGMHEQIDDLIVQVNARYTDQNRPYHIQLGEGGYRLVLRPEYNAVRNRVFGLGPREVRLSQDALEVLALVAYQQPVTRGMLEATSKPNVASLVRQLLRLELIVLERGPAGKDDIRYRTSDRFLQLFALERLEDLPRPEDLMFK